MKELASIKLVDVLERSFVVASLFLMANDVLYVIACGGDPAVFVQTEKYPLVQIIKTCLYVVTVVFALPHWRRLTRVCSQSKLLLGVVLVAVLSVFWSVSPQRTIVPVFGLAATTLFAVYLAARFQPEEFIWLLAVALGLNAILSLVSVAVLPQWAIDQGGRHFGCWRGLSDHKNALGQNVGLGVVVFFLLARHENRWRWLYWLLALLGGFIVLMTGSRTAWIVLGCVILSYPLLPLLRAHVSILLPALMVGIVVAATAVQVFAEYSASIFQLLGRDTTLTGRTTLWAAVLSAGMDKPWLGHGYQAFWVANSETTQEIWGAVGWTPLSAHNGYLDVWLDLGFVGLVFFLAVMAVAFRAITGELRRGHGLTSCWHGMALLYILVWSFVGFGILIPFKITWVVFVATVCFATMTAPRDEPAAFVSSATSNEQELPAKAVL